MIVKTSVSFLTSSSDAQLITTTAGIIAGLTNNPTYPTPSPTLPVVTSALNAFSAAVAAAVGGGVALTSAKNDKRAKLVALLRELASYVQVACKGDLTKLLTSGFPIQKPTRQPVGVLPPPANLFVRLGARSGELEGKADPVSGALIYNWRLSAAASPDTPLQAVQTSAASNTFAGLTPGVAYSVEVNVVGTAGPSNWSDPASQIAV